MLLASWQAIARVHPFIGQMQTKHQVAANPQTKLD